MDTFTHRDYEDYLNESQAVISETAHAEEDEASFYEEPTDADWLREAGFDFFLEMPKEPSEEPDGNCSGLLPDLEALMSTYTYAQKQTVRKRLKNYQTTVRKKKAKSKVPDVRDVFASSEDLSDLESRSRSHSYDDESSSGRPAVLRPQSSVVDTRLVLKASPEERSFMTEVAEKSKKSAFMRSSNKQEYKVSSEYLAGGDSGGVEVLSFSYRSSMKKPPQHPQASNGSHQVAHKHPLFSQEEEEEEIQDLGFEVLDSATVSMDLLPEARVVSGPLGVSCASDLGKDDNKKMRALALIELTALFDEHGLSYSRRKAAKKKLKDTVFGSSLLSLVEDDRRRYPACKIPVFLDKMLRQLEQRGLHEEGLLRIAGSRQKVEALKALVGNNWRTSPRVVDEALEKASVHDIVSLLKNFIRELPEPLLTYKLMDAFLKSTDLPSTVDQLKALNLLVLLLPETNRETLKRLTSFMVSVASASSRNRMSMQNVAVIMAPNLFPPKGSLKKDTVLTHEVAGAAKSAGVARMLIHYHHCLWIVPPSLLRQIRIQNEEIALSKIHKGAKYHHRPSKKSSLTSERTILVHIPGPPNSRTVQQSVNNNTSARDILDAAAGSFPKDRFAVSLECLDLLDSLHLDRELYEVGGNIEEHRLDPIVRISAILRENPDARFQIRPVQT